jgi:hypothetical protein
MQEILDRRKQEEAESAETGGDIMREFAIEETGD